MTELANTKGFENHELNERFLLKKVAKETYKYQHKAYIDKSMGSELKMMIQFYRIQRHSEKLLLFI